MDGEAVKANGSNSLRVLRLYLYCPVRNKKSLLFVAFCPTVSSRLHCPRSIQAIKFSCTFMRHISLTLRLSFITPAFVKRVLGINGSIKLNFVVKFELISITDAAAEHETIRKTPY